MFYEEAQAAAAKTILNLAHDEKKHEQFVRLRAVLEDMCISRELFEAFARAYFLDLTRRERPEYTEEELPITAEAKTQSFMWLLDNV